MANAQDANVHLVDTTAALPSIKRVCAIKYYGAAASSVVIRSESGGVILWQEDSTGDVFEEVKINSAKGIHVTVTGTATVNIYQP